MNLRHAPRLWRAAARALLVLLLTAGPAAGVEVTGLYTVEQTLEPGAADAESRAYEGALKAVLVRITGRESAADDPDLMALFPNPRQYVLRYQPKDQDTLVITLDGRAIETLLRGAGYPVWDRDRPLTIVWLAVDLGPGNRQIVAAAPEGRGRTAAVTGDRSAELRQEILDAAARRGVPVVFPALDDRDRGAVAFADVWGGFDEALVDASRRYSAPSILVGRVRGNDPFHRWSHYLGNHRQNWTGTPATAIELLADELAERFSYAGSGASDSLTLTISGVDSVEAFGTVQSLLDDIGAVDGYRVDTVAGDEIRYIVSVAGGVERLRTALEFSGVLEQPDWLGAGGSFDEPGSRTSLRYVYRPPAGAGPLNEGLPGPIIDGSDTGGDEPPSGVRNVPE